MDTTPRTSDRRHKIKTCRRCGREDWFYGSKKVCSACLAEYKASSFAKQKQAAQAACKNAIKRGELVRQPCILCEAGGFYVVDVTHAHHEDYSKPLDVIWLCPHHHHQRHSEIRKRCWDANLLPAPTEATQTAEQMVEKYIQRHRELRQRYPDMEVRLIPSDPDYVAPEKSQ